MTGDDYVVAPSPLAEMRQPVAAIPDDFFGYPTWEQRAPAAVRRRVAREVDDFSRSLFSPRLFGAVRGSDIEQPDARGKDGV